MRTLYATYFATSYRIGVKIYKFSFNQQGYTCKYNETRHRASTEHSLTFRVRAVVTATQPVHRLQIRPIVHNCRRAPHTNLHPGQHSSVGIRPRTDRHAHRRTRVTNIHFASPTTHAKCNNKHKIAM